MKIESVLDEAFRPFGRVLEGYDFTQLLKLLCDTTPKPTGETVYVASDAALEKLPVFDTLADNCYGGMPIQIGYCNGSNNVLNCLEYHRGSEVNLPADDIVLLLAPLQSVRNNKLDTAEVRAFLVPAGTAVLLYETTLHYAPCNVPGSDGFRVIVVLPRGTNTAKPTIDPKNAEDALLWACNKWLLAHPDSAKATRGAVAGLTGKNITVE